MDKVESIPMFPLAILPLPGELVPLHIFEPRYKQLLQDAEHSDVSFGIYFNQVINEERIGSLMKLESVIKRYPGGESDIIVKCLDIFHLDNLYRTFKSKLYPEKNVRFWQVDLNEKAGGTMNPLFQDYMNRRNITRQQAFFSIYSMAQELNLENNERYEFLLAEAHRREQILMNKLKFQLHVLSREELSRDTYHLN